MITTESVKPHPHSPLYRYVTSGNDVKRNFIHILPPRRDSHHLKNDFHSRVG